ncbi:MAG TPA: flagellar basal body-associated FliL family protein [Firmicutes bacterium]|nr:flagellar basal body-associated FliL family protein [Bacillota bacterium]
MADKTGAVSKEGKEGKKPEGGKLGLSSGLVILGFALVLISAMGSAFLAVTFLGKGGNGPKAEAAAGSSTGKGTSQFGPTQEIGNFTVNLADSGAGAFVKAGVCVEVSNAETVAELTSRDPQVKDIVISVLSSRTMAEVATPQGKEALKKEIQDRINGLLTKGEVKGVFFTEFVFQQ